MLWPAQLFSFVGIIRARSTPGVSTAVRSLALATPLPAATQWLKISSVVNNGVNSADLMGRLQRSSGEQLDAASYALDLLKSELAGALTPKAIASARYNISSGSPLRREQRQMAALAA